MKKPDRRVIRTRRFLRDALTALIFEKDYDAITVQDITDRANLRRATFYLHYQHKDELLLAILEETFEALAKQLETLSGEDWLAGPTRPTAALAVFRHMDEHWDLYQMVLNVHGGGVTTRRIRDYVAAQVRPYFESLAAETPQFPADVQAFYVAGSLLALISWWLENDRPHSAEVMAQTFQRLILLGVTSSR